MIKGLATRDYFLCAQLLQTDREYCASLQTSISSITGIQILMYMHKLCVKSHLCECFECLDCEFLKLGKLLLKLNTDCSGKFVPMEINPLCGIVAILISLLYHDTTIIKLI